MEDKECGAFSRSISALRKIVRLNRKEGEIDFYSGIHSPCHKRNRGHSTLSIRRIMRRRLDNLGEVIAIAWTLTGPLLFACFRYAEKTSHHHYNVTNIIITILQTKQTNKQMKQGLKSGRQFMPDSLATGVQRYLTPQQ